MEQPSHLQSPSASSTAASDAALPPQSDVSTSKASHANVASDPMPAAAPASDVASRGLRLLADSEAEQTNLHALTLDDDKQLVGTLQLMDEVRAMLQRHLSVPIEQTNELLVAKACLTLRKALLPAKGLLEKALESPAASRGTASRVVLQQLFPSATLPSDSRLLGLHSVHAQFADCGSDPLRFWVLSDERRYDRLDILEHIRKRTCNNEDWEMVYSIQRWDDLEIREVESHGGRSEDGPSTSTEAAPAAASTNAPSVLTAQKKIFLLHLNESGNVILGNGEKSPWHFRWFRALDSEAVLQYLLAHPEEFPEYPVAQFQAVASARGGLTPFTSFATSRSGAMLDAAADRFGIRVQQWKSDEKLIVMGKAQGTT